MEDHKSKDKVPENYGGRQATYFREVSQAKHHSSPATLCVEKTGDPSFKTSFSFTVKFGETETGSLQCTGQPRKKKI